MATVLCEHRIEALKVSGAGTQFGHDGRHRGNGSPDCPREMHHHHDCLCTKPTLAEWLAAGFKGEDFPTTWPSRAGGGPR